MRLLTDNIDVDEEFNGETGSGYHSSCSSSTEGSSAGTSPAPTDYVFEIMYGDAPHNPVFELEDPHHYSPLDASNTCFPSHRSRPLSPLPYHHYPLDSPYLPLPQPPPVMQHSTSESAAMVAPSFEQLSLVATSLMNPSLHLNPVNTNLSNLPPTPEVMTKPKRFRRSNNSARLGLVPYGTGLSRKPSHGANTGMAMGVVAGGLQARKKTHVPNLKEELDVEIVRNVDFPVLAMWPSYFCLFLEYTLVNQAVCMVAHGLDKYLAHYNKINRKG